MANLVSTTVRFFSALRVHEASPGTHTFFPSYTRHVYRKRLRAAIGFWLVWQSCPRLRPDMIPVRRARVLPCGVFFPQSGFLQIPRRRGHPCLRLTLPAAGRVRDFHPIERALAGRTRKRRCLNSACLAVSRQRLFAFIYVGTCHLYNVRCMLIVI